MQVSTGSVPGTGESTCKGPGLGVSPAQALVSEEASVAGTAGAREEWREMRSEEDWGRGCAEELVFHSKCTEETGEWQDLTEVLTGSLWLCVENGGEGGSGETREEAPPRAQ